jgi:putative copper export protein
LTAILTFIGWLDLVATIALVGGIIYATAIGPPSPRSRRVMRAAALLLGVVLALELGVTAWRLGAASSTTGFEFWGELLSTQWGRWWIVRGVGLGALVASARIGGRFSSGLAALWLLPRSFQGHAGAHGAMSALIDWIHLLAATCWLGALVQVAGLSRPLPVTVANRLRRLATISLIALIPAGFYGAFLHIPNTERLLNSPYGRALLAKLALVVLLVGFGTVNHFVSVPAVHRGDPRAAQRLYRVVQIEVAIGAIVIIFSALLGVLPMPHGMP